MRAICFYIIGVILLSSCKEEDGYTGPIAFAKVLSEVPQVYLGSGNPLALSVKAYDLDSQEVQMYGWQFHANDLLIDDKFQPASPGTYLVWATKGDLSTDTLEIEAVAKKEYPEASFQVIFHLVNMRDFDLNKIDQSIQLANRAFTNDLGSKNPNAQSVNFRFNLAQYDQEGRILDPPGIVYVEDFPDSTKLSVLQKFKRSHQWNPDQYINVWVSDIHPNAWSTFPSTDCDHKLSGLKCLQDHEEVVLSAVNLQRNHVGSDSDTFVHELGHFFGLFHVFTPSCHWDNDHCSDTPKYFHFENPRHTPLICNGIKFIQDNHMDYGEERSFSFSYQQAERMRHVLKYGRYTANNRGLN